MFMGKDFVFNMVLKQISLSTTKFGGHKNNLGSTAPSAPPWLRVCAAVTITKMRDADDTFN